LGKKTASFSLETDILQKIDKVKSDLNLSSRSSALERIILAYGDTTNNGMDRDSLKTLIKEVLTESNDSQPSKENSVSSLIGATIEDAFSDMKD
jgi:metal-responsive CopG/Arc/MetJ family transcriptional regulator